MASNCKPIIGSFMQNFALIGASCCTNWTIHGKFDSLISSIWVCIDARSTNCPLIQLVPSDDYSIGEKILTAVPCTPKFSKFPSLSGDFNSTHFTRRSTVLRICVMMTKGEPCSNYKRKGNKRKIVFVLFSACKYARILTKRSDTVLPANNTVPAFPS